MKSDDVDTTDDRVYRNEYHRITTERNLKVLAGQQPGTVEEFKEQVKEGTSAQRELFMKMIDGKVSPDQSPKEKLEIIKTVAAAQHDYYMKDPDVTGDEMVAYYQLSQLVAYAQSWGDLKGALCVEADYEV